MNEAKFRYGCERLVMEENYLGPDRRQRIRRFGKGTRSGMERRRNNAQWAALEKRRNDERRSDNPRRTIEERRQH